jgi:uncharacterized protein (TIGR03435 family)
VPFRRKLIFAAASLALAVFCARAQTVPPAPAFDVASIRENIAHDQHTHNSIYNDPAESHFRTANLSVRALLQYAYGLPATQILGGPAWLDSTPFDIDAKSDATVDAQLHALPDIDARQRKKLMVQALLADRFQLKTHQETRELPIFNLVVANPKTGPKFKPSEADGTSISSSTGSGIQRIHVQGSDNTIELLARELAQSLGRVVVDKTGIDARYDLTLRWMPADRPPPMLNGAPDPNPPPDLFTAIQEQLGLKLEPSKGPVPVLVVDHVELPSEN